ncbi:MAG: sulfurtransferase [Terriglobales bacterium]
MNPRFWAPVVALLVFLVAGSPATAQRKVKVPPLRANMVVSTDWLADHMNDPTVVVIHVGQKRADYEAAHIPGARFLWFDKLAVSREGLNNQLPPVADLQKLFSDLGVGDDSRVVLYGDREGLSAARAYWTLDYLGHGDRAALLDGGLEKWRREERPVTNVVRKFAPAKFTVRLNPKVLAQLPEVREYSRKLTAGQNTVALIDTRPTEDYTGHRQQHGLGRAGHIPGATNVDWHKLVERPDSPDLRPTPEMRELFAAAGATPGKKVVTYCNTGVQAAYGYFVAKFLGYDVSLYDGSLQEWNHAKDTEVMSGK